MNTEPNSTYEYQVGGSLPINAPTYVKRQADDDLYNGLKSGEFCYTTKPVGKGTGLGLSISYQIIVENHKGELKCISESGKGSEFVIKIPNKFQYKRGDRFTTC